MFGKTKKPQSKTPFPFREREDTLVFTCKHVLQGESPVLYAFYDGDGDWQFLCDGAHTTEDARLVSLGEMVRLDPTLGELAVLTPGHRASRPTAEDLWEVEACPGGEKES